SGAVALRCDGTSARVNRSVAAVTRWSMKARKDHYVGTSHLDSGAAGRGARQGRGGQEGAFRTVGEHQIGQGEHRQGARTCQAGQDRRQDEGDAAAQGRSRTRSGEGRRIAGTDGYRPRPQGRGFGRPAAGSSHRCPEVRPRNGLRAHSVTTTATLVATRSDDVDRASSPTAPTSVDLIPGVGPSHAAASRIWPRFLPVPFSG